MNITEVRVKLTEDPHSKLKAYCSVTFNNEFVVRDLKIIEGARGPFVAMPSRKLSDRCVQCSAKNHLQSNYCHNCGHRLRGDRAPRDGFGRVRLHADLAHPINSTCRIALHKAVVMAFREELEKSQLEGYQPTSFDDFDDLPDFIDESYIEELAQRQRDRQSREAGA